jgi:hypothetical protein
MENDSKKRVGRPKTAPQTGPLVLGCSRARTKIEVELAAEIADELREYARWVELSSSLTTDDAASTTVDFALRELFRRDRMWQARRREPERKEGGSPERKDTPPPAPTTSRPLPPPNGTGAARGAAERAP